MQVHKEEKLQSPFADGMTKENQSGQSPQASLSCVWWRFFHWGDLRRAIRLLKNADCTNKYSADLSESDDPQSAYDGVDEGDGMFHAGRRSVKELIDEELAQPQPTQASTDDVEKSALEVKREKGSGSADSADEQGSGSADSADLSDINPRFAPVLLAFLRHYNEKAPTDSGSNLNSAEGITTPPDRKSRFKMALSDVTEDLIKQQKGGKRGLTSDGGDQSKEFMDALQQLSSNRELLWKLVQDRTSVERLERLLTESPGVSRSSELQAISSGESLNKPKRRLFSFKEDKMVEKKPPKTSSADQKYSRIVVLKPSTKKNHSHFASSSLKSSVTLQAHEERKKGTQFSLDDIRKRVLHAFGETQKENHVGNTDKPKLEDLPGSPKNDSARSPEPSLYEEAKKYWDDIMDDQQPASSLPNLMRSHSLARLMYLSDHDSVSPGRSPKKTINSQVPDGPELQHFLKQTAEQDSPQNFMSSEMPEMFKCDEDNILAGILKYFEPESIKALFTAESTTEDAKLEDMPTSAESTEASDTPNVETTIYEGKDDSTNTDSSEDPDEPELNLPHSDEPLCVKQDQPSSSSVLDTPFPGDTAASNRGSAKRGDLFFQRASVCVNEPQRYSVWSDSPVGKPDIPLFSNKDGWEALIRGLLETAGLSEESDKRQKSDSLLDSPLFSRVHTSDSTMDDEKIIVDCIKEVLAEIQEKYFNISSWTNSQNCLSRADLSEQKIISEVFKAIDHYADGTYPTTMDRMVAMDLDSRDQMNFCCETEGIVVEIWDTLFDDLLEEAAFDLWFEN